MKFIIEWNAGYVTHAEVVGAGYDAIEYSEDNCDDYGLGSEDD